MNLREETQEAPYFLVGSWVILCSSLAPFPILLSIAFSSPQIRYGNELIGWLKMP